MTLPDESNSFPVPTASVLRGWPVTSLYLVCAAVLFSGLCIFLPPSGKRFVDILQPGAADLLPSVNAADALLKGVNPYHQTHLLFPDPYFFSRGQNEGVTYLYPPSHALLYVPLTWLADGDYPAAIRLQFTLSVTCVLVLSWIVLRLLRSVVALGALYARSLFPCITLLLGLNVGNMLGIERGQSDLVTAAFAWCAIVCFCRRHLVLAAFFSVAATLLKGYGLVLCAGLLPLAALENWRRTLLGAIGALVVLLAPVARYLPDAIAAYQIRSAMFWSGWTNQGFANLAFSLGLPRDDGRLALAALTLGGAALAWLQLLRTRRHPNDAARALWAVAFGTTALSCVIGYSLNCISYAVIVVMPGVLVLALGQQRLLRQLPTRLRFVLGGVLAVASAGMFLFDLAEATGSRAPWLSVPLSAAGQVAVTAVVAICAFAALRSARVRTAGVVAVPQ